MASKLAILGKLRTALRRSPEAIERAAAKAERRADALHELEGAKIIETSAAGKVTAAAEAHAAEVAAEQAALQKASEAKRAAAEAETAAAKAETVAAKAEQEAARNKAHSARETRNTDLELAAIEKETAKTAAKEAKNTKEPKKKKWSTPKKIVVGGGAAAGAIAGYNVLSGANNNTAPLMAASENAGSQAAVNDAMAEMQMQAPMPQVQAANLNYQGPMMAGAQVARG